MSDLLVIYESCRPFWSSATSTLSFRYLVLTKQGEAAFSFYAPQLWNTHIENLRCLEALESFILGLMED